MAHIATWDIQSCNLFYSLGIIGEVLHHVHCSLNINIAFLKLKAVHKRHAHATDAQIHIVLILFSGLNAKSCYALSID